MRNDFSISTALVLARHRVPHTVSVMVALAFLERPQTIFIGSQCSKSVACV
jgi:hypothetical protein